MEILYSVPGRKSMGANIVGWIVFAAALLPLVLFFLMGGTMFFILFLIVGALWFFLCFRTVVEFDYSYFPDDGDFEVAKITNKRKRRLILRTNLDEMQLLAPEDSPYVQQYLGDASYRHIDFSSGRRGIRCYLLFCQGRKSKVCLRFEPDDRILQAVKERNETGKKPGKVVV